MNRSFLSLACMAAYTSGTTSASTLLLHDTRHAGDSKFVSCVSCIGTDDAGPGAAITDGKKPDDIDGATDTAQQQAQSANGGTQQANAADTTDTSGAKTTVVGDPPAGIGRKQAGFSLVELMGALGIWLTGVMGVSTVAPYAKAAIAWAGQFFS